MDKINPYRLFELMKDCLFHEGELAEGEMPENAIVVQGIMNRFGFHRERLFGHTDEIIQMLSLLPDEFRKDIGGGWSFLNICTDRNGYLWTGFHKCCDELICLGIGVGKAGYIGTPELWPFMPGGMPYVWVDIDITEQ